MRFSQAFLSLSLAISTYASPAPVPIVNTVTAAECKIVSAVVSAFNLLPSATPFCSSFLSIKTSTSTVTRTATSPTTAVFSTITGTNVITAPSITVTSTATTTITICPQANKRNIEERATITTTAKTTTTPFQACTKPPILSSFQCSAISTACGCLSLKTPTITVTATATVAATIKVTTKIAATNTVKPTNTVVITATNTVTACPTPTGCNNAGLQYAVWYNSQPYTDFYPDFDPTVYKSDVAEFIGNSTVGKIGPINTGACLTNDATCKPGIIYNTPVASVGEVVVDHRGYFIAPETGYYWFDINVNDDIVLLWIGDTAYSGWERDNAQEQGTSPGYDFETDVFLSAGQTLPIRIMWANGGGQGNFDFGILDPEGNDIAGSDSADPNPYLIQYSCDGTYPQYPPWNAET